MPGVAVIQPHRGIGDMIWQVPALRAIAAQAPDGRVDLITRPQVSAAALFAAEPMVAAVHHMPAARGAFGVIANSLRLLATLRRGRYRSVYILHDSPRYGLLARLAGVPERIGYAPRRGANWLTRAVEVGIAAEGIDIVAAMDRFLAETGLPDADPRPSLAVSPPARAAVRQRWADRPGPWVVLGVGATSSDRRWPIDRFGDLAAGLAGAGTVFLLGSPGERAAVDEIRKRAGGAPVPVTDLSIDGALGLLAECSLFVGNDSGPMNMAAAVGVPVIGLIGSSGSRVRCSRFPSITPIHPPGGPSPDGMERIPAADVLQAAKAALAQAPVGA